MTTHGLSLIRWRKSLPVLLVVGLLSCATPYTSHSVLGGFSEERISDTRYRVRFDGNGFATKDRVWYFWIYRCAELTKQKGFTYFTYDTTTGSSRSHFNGSSDQDRYGGAAYQPAGGRNVRNHAQPALYRPGGAGPLVRAKGGGGYTYYYYTTQTTTWHSNAIVTMMNEIPIKTVVLEAQSILDDVGPYVFSNGDLPPVPRETLFNNASCILGPTLKVLRRKDFPDQKTIHPMLQPNLPPAAKGSETR